MRAFVILCCLFAAPASADAIFSNSKIISVTVYPQGAQLTRLVEFDAKAGEHDLLVTDLPQNIDPLWLRLRPDEGMQIGAHSLRTDRVSPHAVKKSDAQVAAETARDAAEAEVRAAQAALDGVTARIDAAQAQIDYLSRLGASDGKTEVEVLQGVSRMIGAEVLAASNAAIAARADLPAAQRALEKAQAVLDALPVSATDYAALSLAITTQSDGPHRLEMTQFVGDAAWSPVYDAALDRKAGQVVLDRGLLVAQSTGEDWVGVALTLSTAQPGQAAEPGKVWPQLHRIEDPAPDKSMTYDTEQGAGFMVEPVIAPAPTGMVVAASRSSVQFDGDIVSYTYPSAVDIADGVENLRLALDQVTLPATVRAQAVPRQDATAFVMAELVNESGQILLPGPAFLTRDGAFVGQVELATVAPGAKAEIGFGAVEGLRLKRLVPSRAEGDRGVFSKSNQIEETAVLSVENLTADEWDIRVIDGVPYSEQEQLIITFVADPPVSETDFEGKRGVLVWDWKLAAGQRQDFKLTTRESWPEGKVLNGFGRY